MWIKLHALTSDAVHLIARDAVTITTLHKCGMGDDQTANISHGCGTILVELPIINVKRKFCPNFIL